MRSHRSLQLGMLLVLSVGMTAAPQGRWPATVVEWAPDGKVLIAANGLLARFDLDSGEEELLDGSGVTFALSPPGASGVSRLAVAGLNRLELRGYPDFKVQSRLTLPDSGKRLVIESLAWAADGTTLAVGTASGRILLWLVPPALSGVEGSAAEGDIDSREIWADLSIAPASPVARLRFSADGKRLLSAFADGRAVLWDLERREVLHRFEPEAGAPVSGGLERTGRAEGETAVVALSPDGRHVLATEVRGGEAELVLREVGGPDSGGRVLWRRPGYGLEFTPDGAGVLALAPPFRLAALYPAERDAAALRTFEPPEEVETLYLVRLSPDGTKLLGVGEDARGQVLIVWDFATAHVLKTHR